MRLIFLVLVFILTGCEGGVRVDPDIKPPVIDTGDVNILLYLVSVIGVAAGLAMIVWTPFKQLGAFIATMFGAIVAIIVAFATIIKIMPWVVGGACVVALGFGIFYIRRHWLTVVKYVDVHEKDMPVDVKKIIGLPAKVKA